MNLSYPDSVPFEIPGINHGLKKVEGLVMLDETGLALEFEEKDDLLGIWKSGVRNVHIPYGELESIQFKKGFLSGRLILKGVSLKTFEAIPGTEVATCRLKIKRRDSESAARLSSHARAALSEYRLNELGGEGDQ
jgi:hypothetical protein